MSVSRRSSVASTSRIDFTPAQTTVIGVWPSVVRSADSSQLSRASRCTPPSPPVANTPIPARTASVAVAATVVAPVARRAITTARSRALHLATSSPGDRVERLAVEPDADHPVDDRDRRGHRSLVPDRRLDHARDLDVVGPRQPVGDQRALQRHHRAPFFDRRRDLAGVAHHGVTVQRAARVSTAALFTRSGGCPYGWRAVAAVRSVYGCRTPDIAHRPQRPLRRPRGRPGAALGRHAGSQPRPVARARRGRDRRARRRRSRASSSSSSATCAARR